MATEGVTGSTKEELEERRETWKKYDHDRSFEEAHCLCPIKKQPPDYSGPDRFCTLRRDLSETPNGKIRCKHHGGRAGYTPENLEKLAAMKHGMQATRENLIEDFDEKDQALYDWIMHEWPEAYDIDFDEEPAAMFDLHRLAAEIVRGERGRGYLIEEGEIHEQDRYSEDGSLVIDNESGEVVTEKSEHYLAQMLHRQDKKITQLEKELGITRKEQLRQDSTDSAVEAMKSFAELGDAFIGRDDKSYDPDERPWEEEENESGEDS